MRRLRARSAGDDGASAVEFALLLPLFAMLVFGMISAGFAFQSWLTVTHGAQESARFAATLSIPASAAPNPGTASTWLTAVSERAVSASDLGTTAAMTPGSTVCVAIQAQGNVPSVAATRLVLTSDAAGAVVSQTASGACPGMPAPSGPDWVQVFVSTPADFNYILGSATIDVVGKSTSRFEAVSIT